MVTHKGVLVFYINVGQLPPYTAEAYLDRLSDTLLRSRRFYLPEDIGAIFIPVRNQQETRVDYVPLDAASAEAVEQLKAVRDELKLHYAEQKIAESKPKSRGLFGFFRSWFKKLFP